MKEFCEIKTDLEFAIRAAERTVYFSRVQRLSALELGFRKALIDLQNHPREGRKIKAHSLHTTVCEAARRIVDATAEELEHHFSQHPKPTPVKAPLADPHQRALRAVMATEESLGSVIARTGQVPARQFLLFDALARIFLSDEKFRKEVLGLDLTDEVVAAYSAAADEDLFTLRFTDKDIMRALEPVRKLRALDVQAIVEWFRDKRLKLDSPWMYQKGKAPIRIGMSMDFFRSLLVISTAPLPKAHTSLPVASRTQCYYKALIGGAALVFIHNICHRFAELPKDFYNLSEAAQLIWRDVMPLEPGKEHWRLFSQLVQMLGWKKTDDKVLVSQQNMNIRKALERLKEMGLVVVWRTEGHGIKTRYAITTCPKALRAEATKPIVLSPPLDYEVLPEAAPPKENPLLKNPALMKRLGLGSLYGATPSAPPKGES